ncbi:hypothetical protein ACFQFC_08315 [Amorphoplanes digitatis]|uniref:Uncharacterized protein n=1 Tax=Actinoplanes digitatis TaxID=1868 RepID=A0A7W7I0V0_9ACTN|nr:hypothetical protein [Actinoplanes digitatis]MBB4764208.1 hypothetical protein [Actinoplanes digitatis]BFE73582.1 hypothetical protein GCM10020092_068830 [Actinoplanes digitatis]GID97825.1 hypothetical protein Adi01nite_72370 [Actinoplanes digitatis]
MSTDLPPAPAGDDDTRQTRARIARTLRLRLPALASTDIDQHVERVLRRLHRRQAGTRSAAPVDPAPRRYCQIGR